MQSRTAIIQPLTVKRRPCAWCNYRSPAPPFRSYFQPFLADTDDILSEVTQWVVVFSIIVTIVIFFGVGSDDEGNINIVGLVFIALQAFCLVFACGLALSDLSEEKEYVAKKISSLKQMSFRRRQSVSVQAIIKFQSLSRSFLARNELERRRWQKRSRDRQDPVQAEHLSIFLGALELEQGSSERRGRVVDSSISRLSYADFLSGHSLP